MRKRLAEYKFIQVKIDEKLYIKGKMMLIKKRTTWQKLLEDYIRSIC